MSSEPDFLDPESISWPARGRSLFAADVKVSPPALLEDGFGSWWNYAESYRFAAAALVERFEATGHDQDFLAMPALFLYRQHAELALKYLEREAFEYLGRPLPPFLGHSLKPRWDSVEGALREVWPGQYEDEYAAVGETIDQLQAVDPTSDTFRYPVNSAGTPNLDAILKRFDLLNFGREMERFAHWVGGAADALEAEKDALADMREAERDAMPSEWEF